MGKNLRERSQQQKERGKGKCHTRLPEKTSFVDKKKSGQKRGVRSHEAFLAREGREPEKAGPERAILLRKSNPFTEGREVSS